MQQTADDFSQVTPSMTTAYEKSEATLTSTLTGSASDGGRAAAIAIAAAIAKACKWGAMLDGVRQFHNSELV